MTTKSGRLLDKDKLTKCLSEMRSTFAKGVQPPEALKKKEEESEDPISSQYFSKAKKTKKSASTKRPPIKIEFDETLKDKKPKLERYNSLLEKLEKYCIQDRQVDGKWFPPEWQKFLSNLALMRSMTDAPVDTMGCDQFSDGEADPKVQRFHVLISLMLSSQTKDQVTYGAMQRLKVHGLTIDNILATSEEVLAQLIHPVGFTKTKVKYIKKTSQTLKEDYDYDIPDSIEGLCKLTGVGPKMAHICMNVAWNKVTGIGVDTHVHRISNRIGWVPKPTKTPEDTRKALEEWLPHELWSDVNHLLVGFGQTICQPIKPKCSECANIDICPYKDAKVELKNQAKSYLQDVAIKTEISDEPKKIKE